MILNSVFVQVISLVIIKLSCEVIAYRSMPIYKSVYKRPVRLNFYEPKYLVFSHRDTTCITNKIRNYTISSTYNSYIKTWNKQGKPFIVYTIPNQKKYEEDITENVSGNSVKSSTVTVKSKLKKKYHEVHNIKNENSETESSSDNDSNAESNNFQTTSEKVYSRPDITTNNVQMHEPFNNDKPATVSYPTSELEITNNDLSLLIADVPLSTTLAANEISTNNDMSHTLVANTNYNFISTSDDLLPRKHEKYISFADIKESLNQFERKFFNVTYRRLLSTSPAERKENGISFAISGLFLYMMLITLASEVDQKTRDEIQNVTGFPFYKSDGSHFIKEIVSTLPLPYEALKFYWSCRLVHNSLNISNSTEFGPAAALSLHLNSLSASDTPEIMAKMLNKMVESDSRGAMHNTFEEEDISEGVAAIMLSTVYVRASWRTAPTLLNDTRPFFSAEDAPRTARMIRINDVMGYANLTELGAEVLEISYATPGLSLVMVIPYGRSLRAVAAHMSHTGIDQLLPQLTTKRIAATLPLFTLRMTLLLPKKLQEMGIPRLVNTTNDNTDKLRISHAIQRLMFWSEAGRNAFKDDGIEWDEHPEQELVVDRPYVFYVRWQNITLMNGNFVL